MERPGDPDGSIRHAVAQAGRFAGSAQRRRSSQCGAVQSVRDAMASVVANVSDGSAKLPGFTLQFIGPFSRGADLLNRVIGAASLPGVQLGQDAVIINAA